MDNKVLSLMGLAQKAGKICSGEFMTEKSIKTGKARLVIIAQATGKVIRTTLAVTDEGFAKSIEKKMDLGGHADLWQK
jgi:ribosomal protein L7Ae-like RNA K-turn-binding protein